MSQIIGVDPVGIPSATDPNELIDVRYVLVQGEANDVACYVGQGWTEWVAARGSKVSLEEAELHFPGLRTILQQRGLTYRK